MASRQLMQFQRLAARSPMIASVIRSPAGLAPIRLASHSPSSTSTPAQEAVPAHLNTKRDDYLLKFASASSQREFYHYTSYALAAGIPAALFFGPPVSTLADLTFGIVIPLHAHMGMRSVLIDYVHEVSSQQIALMLLAVATGGTVLGLTMFNITDVGLTESIKQLWVKQKAPAAAFEGKLEGRS